ncbi:uncharacterized protein LOC131025538 [Salvia miltiorrhiza]|uniref:uncharacterized protein LOC131025538 n=1 Tax=Salvia miltiorrhiza TaxID=226208 RepID=UPI0025ABF91A|nr:uncharacterized protein LOC131025538 [Salvia miltiorrhiza]
MERGNLRQISKLVYHAGETDGWTWKENKDGIYTTKSAYSCLQAERKDGTEANDSSKTAAMVWDAPALQKAKVTAWRALRKRLPTCDNLRRRNIVIDDVEMNCNACFSPVETVDHTLLHCPKASAVWDGIMRWIGLQSVRPQGLEAHFLSFSQLGNGKKCTKFLKSLWVCTIWILWRQRNASRFEASDFGISGTSF